MFAVNTTACAVKGCYFDSNGQTAATDQGLEFEDSTGTVIDGNYFVDSVGVAIFIQKVSATIVDAVISNNKCERSQYGIYIDKGTDVVISGNVCNNNTEEGILVHNGARCLVNNNICYGNSDDGIVLRTGCINCTVTGNTVYDNADIGISISASRDCNVNANNVMANGGYGIRVDVFSRHTVIVGNRVKNNVLGNISNAGINSTVASNDETGTVARAGLLTETAYIFEPTIVV